MKQIVCIPALFLLGLAAAAAQEVGGMPPAQERTSIIWFGGVGAGVAANDNGAFSDRLKSYTPTRASGENFLYQTGDFSSTGLTLNAGGGFVLGNGLMIGASGERVSYPTVSAINGPGTPRDEYTLSGGGGGLDIGYAMVNSESTLLCPYIQGGYYGYTLDYTNNQNEPIPFFEGEPVPAGATASYTGAAPRVALGVGMVKLIGGGGESSPVGGFVVAARLAWGTMLSRPRWQEPGGGDVNNGGLTPAYNGVSLSVSIGGGMGRFSR